MTSFDREALAEARQLHAGLRELADERAPESFVAAVLARVGLGDAYARLNTPIGPVFVAYTPEGVSAVARAGEPADFEAAYRRRTGRDLRALAKPPEWLVHPLLLDADGNPGRKLRFDLRGLSEFEQAVLLKALDIPRGEVRPYAWIAREIGRPGAVRAVGTALKHNPVPLLIPCHRVVRSDGTIGEYALGGGTAKRAVLAAEGLDVDDVETLARGGIRYLGSGTTHIYCYPSCRHARRITDRHRVPFPTEAAATAAGYRPCKVCRPA